MVRLPLCVALVLTVLGASRTTAAAADGAAVFAAQKCGLCHSIAGKGNAKGALDDVGRRLTPDDIRQWLTSPKEMAAKHKAERKPAMKSYVNLPKEDVDALVAYLAALKGAK